MMKEKNKNKVIRWSDELIAILTTFVKTEGFKWTYMQYCSKKEIDYNIALLSKLLDIQKKLILCAKKDNNFEIAMNVVHDGIITISTLMDQEIVECLGKNLVERHCKDILFLILNDYSGENNYSTIALEIFDDNFLSNSNNLASKELLLRIITIVSVENIRRNNLDFVKEFINNYLVKKHYWDNWLSNRFFLLISFYLYYIYQFDKQISKSTKETIELIIKNENIPYSPVSYSYKEVLLSLINNVDFPFKQFIDTFMDVQNNVGTPKTFKFEGLNLRDNDVAVYWYITFMMYSNRDDLNEMLKFNRSGYDDIIFNSFYEILKMDYEYKNSAKKKKQNETNPKQDLFKMVDHFYGYNDKNFEEFIFGDEKSNVLLDSINSSLICIIQNNSYSFDGEKIKENIEKFLKAKIKSEYGFNEKTEIATNAETFNVSLGETCKYFLFYDIFTKNKGTEELISKISDELNKRIIKNKNIKLISKKDSNFNEEIKNNLETQSAKIFCNNIELIDQLNALVKNNIINKTPFNDPFKLFREPTIIVDDGFSLALKTNVTIDNFEIENIKKELKDKENDALYIYQYFRFKTQREYIDFKNKLNVKINVSCSFEIKIDKDKIIQIVD